MKDDLVEKEPVVQTKAVRQAKVVVKLKQWLGSLLYPLFVPMEEYAFVQMARWSADKHIEYLVKEQSELLDSIYRRKYDGLEQYVSASVAVEQRFETEDLEATEFAWRIRFPHWRFYTMYNPREEVARARDYAIRRLASAFMDHLNKNFFGRGQSDISNLSKMDSDTASY